MKAAFIILTICCSLISSSESYAQINNTQTSTTTYHKEIKETFSQFLEAVKQKDMETVVDNMYPKIFDFVPKALLTGAIEDAEEDSSMPNIQNNSIDNISEVLEIDKAKYAIISYSFEMVADMGEDETATEGFDNPDTFDADEFTYEIFVNMYGEDNVNYNKEEQKIYIQTYNQAIAVKEASKWTFVEYKPNMKAMLETILPAEVFTLIPSNTKACKECTSLADALVEPELVESLMVNPNVHGESISHLPESIKELKNIKILYLTDHKSLNSIPKEIGILKNLEELSLAGCNLTELPDEIFELKNLRELLLFDNNFSKRYIKYLKKQFRKKMPDTAVEFE